MCGVQYQRLPKERLEDATNDDDSEAPNRRIDDIPVFLLLSSLNPARTNQRGNGNIPMAGQRLEYLWTDRKTTLINLDRSSDYVTSDFR